jgi:hypothetical protein
MSRLRITMGMGLFAVSHAGVTAGGQDSQVITECLVEGNEDGERLFVAFAHAPNREGCGSDAEYTRVDGTTEKESTSSSSS